MVWFSKYWVAPQKLRGATNIEWRHKHCLTPQILCGVTNIVWRHKHCVAPQTCWLWLAVKDPTFTLCSIRGEQLAMSWCIPCYFHIIHWRTVLHNHSLTASKFVKPIDWFVYRPLRYIWLYRFNTWFGSRETDWVANCRKCLSPDFSHKPSICS